MIQNKTLSNRTYLVARASNDGGEDGSRGVITGKAGLAHATAVVDHEGGHIIVARHFDLALWLVVVAKLQEFGDDSESVGSVGRSVGRRLAMAGRC